MEDAYVLTLKNRKFSEFYLCYCGYAKCEPLHSFGPAVRPNYLIHLILDGKGVYQIGDTKYELSKGQGFLIEPEVQTFYQADKEEPWTYLWIGFSGSRAKEYLADIGLGSGHKIFRCKDTSGLREILNEILKRNTYTVENDFYREGFLYSFFGLLSQNIKSEAASQKETENLYVREALEYTQNNYHYGIRVSDIADYVGVSRGYLHTLFTKTLGQSPQEYLVNYRITRAQQLLEITDLPVEGVAQSCGYSDPLVFSKLFKKRTGKTPSAYRKEST
ncbi:MAG TPA: AraC family transcriptional regulator [Candidatus Mediterraneibacter caccogallinarum]|nr:AraC family transcriptional regulator [Candidatus Mediterraneibacter caccogallinarum]